LTCFNRNNQQHAFGFIGISILTHMTGSLIFLIKMKNIYR